MFLQNDFCASFAHLLSVTLLFSSLLRDLSSDSRDDFLVDDKSGRATLTIERAVHTVGAQHQLVNKPAETSCGRRGRLSGIRGPSLDLIPSPFSW